MINLAISEPTEEQINKLDAICGDELNKAGIKILVLQGINKRTEVPTNVIGELPFWIFTRAWYYWVATGAAIPYELAMELHEQYGKEVRVNGNCTCPSPQQANNGGYFGINLYHVDTQDGLKALADLIKKVANKGERN